MSEERKTETVISANEINKIFSPGSEEEVVAV
jgi:hypothetical protein